MAEEGDKIKSFDICPLLMQANAPRRPAPLFETSESDGGEDGFTLLELLVVIVIIGLLAGLVVPRYFDTVGKSKTKVARAQIDAFEKALEQYRLDVGSLPANEQGLNALITPPSGLTKWQGPYLKRAVPLDPWGNPYVYRLSASRLDPEIISFGADGQPGGTGEAKDVSTSSND